MGNISVDCVDVLLLVIRDGWIVISFVTVIFNNLLLYIYRCLERRLNNIIDLKDLLYYLGNN